MVSIAPVASARLESAPPPPTSSLNSRLVAELQRSDDADACRPGVRLRASPPAAFTTKMSPPTKPSSLISPPMKAICLPTGDQRGIANWRLGGGAYNCVITPEAASSVYSLAIHQL